MNVFKTLQIKICSQLRTIVLFHLLKIIITNNLCDIYITTHIKCKTPISQKETLKIFLDLHSYISIFEEYIRSVTKVTE